MSKLPRPYIPLSVRVTVATRQAVGSQVYPRCGIATWPLTSQLRELLYVLFGDEKSHLDHDPALQHRKQIWRNCVFIDYDPPANDPAYLIYRGSHAHVIKTLVRGDGAQYSDAALARKNKRIERNRKGRPVQKIKSRGFR